MGERREALIAGAIPKITPTRMENANARITDQGVTVETRNCARIIDPDSPKAIPIIPPDKDNITASRRN